MFVVIGNVLQGSNTEFDNNLWFRIIYSFHMPLFMFISGAVASIKFNKYCNQADQKNELTALLKSLFDKALRLLVPYTSWNIVAFYIRPVNHESSLSSYLIHMFNHPDEGLWFLPALFWCFVLLDFSVFLASCVKK